MDCPSCVIIVNKLISKSIPFSSSFSLFYEPEDFYTPVETLFPPPEKPQDTATPTEPPTTTQKSPADPARNGGIAVVRGWQVTALDATSKVATLEDGKTVSFDKCLIATGATPKNLDVFTKNPEVRKRVLIDPLIFK